MWIFLKKINLRKFQKFFFSSFQDFLIPPTKHPKAFNLENLSRAVSMVVDGGSTISEASKYYNIPISRVSQGVKDVLKKRHSQVNEMFKIHTKFKK